MIVRIFLQLPVHVSNVYAEFWLRNVTNIEDTRGPHLRFSKKNKFERTSNSKASTVYPRTYKKPRFKLETKDCNCRFNYNDV